MTTNETCPHCGADERYARKSAVEFKCGTDYFQERIYAITSAWYDRQLAAQAAEIERLKTVLTHIALYGGTTDDESGLSHNGSWCAEQARCALEKVT